MDEMKEIDTLLQLNLVLEAKKILAPEKEVIRDKVCKDTKEPERDEIYQDLRKNPESNEVESNSKDIDSIPSTKKKQEAKKPKPDYSNEKELSIKEWLSGVLSNLIEFFKGIPEKIRTMIEKINDMIRRFKGMDLRFGSSSKTIKIVIKVLNDSTGEIEEKKIPLNLKTALTMLKKLGNMIIQVGKNLTGLFKKTSQSAKEGIQTADQNPEVANQKKKEVIKGQKEMSKRFSLIGSYYKACSVIANHLSKVNGNKEQMARDGLEYEKNNASGANGEQGKRAYSEKNMDQYQNDISTYANKADKYKAKANEYTSKSKNYYVRGNK